MKTKLIQERTALKLLIERNGVLLSFTTKRRACFFFLSSKLVGLRFAPTTDPFPGIVEVCDYDIAEIVKNWSRLSNIKLPKKLQAYSTRKNNSA